MLADYLFDVGGGGFNLELYQTIEIDDSRGSRFPGFDESSRGWDG
jgi:hypothetical protein